MTKKVFYLILIIGIVITAVLFWKGCKAPDKPVIISTREVAKVDKVIYDNALKKIDALQKENEALIVASDMNEVKLHAGQTRARLIEKSPIKKYIAVKLPKVDTTQEDTSSIYFLPEDVVKNSLARDSLCNEVIATKNDVIANDQLIIAQKDTIITSIQKSNSLLASQQNDLLKYSKELNSRFKGVKMGNRFWRIGAVVAGVFILKTLLVK
jgi:hypothetical protein